MFRRATFLRETRPYPSLLRYCLSKVVSTSASEHRAGVRATVPAVQVRGECMHTYIHTYMHACMHTYIHTYIHTRAHTHTHTHTKEKRHGGERGQLHFNTKFPAAPCATCMRHRRPMERVEASRPRRWCPHAHARALGTATSLLIIPSSSSSSCGLLRVQYR